MSAALMHQIVVAMFIGLLVWAAVSDYRSYIVPNTVSLSLAALYPAHVAASAAPVDWSGGLVTAGVMFAIGFGLFAARVLGGGDVKLLSAVALWAGPGQIFGFLLITAMAGGVLAFVTVTHLRFVRPLPSGALAPDEGAALKMRQSVPYAVAIAAGGMWMAGRFLSI